MATTLKQTQPSGVRYKAVTKPHSRIVKTKTAACTWAKQTESNLDYLDALGLPGASITIEELAKKYLKYDIPDPASAGFLILQIGFCPGIRTPQLRNTS